MKKIQLSKRGDKHKGKYAVVDDEDYERLNIYNWSYSNGYATRFIFEGPDRKRRTIWMHREILNVADSDIQIDHINDGIDEALLPGLCNQKFNLRTSTQTQNTMNISKRKNTSSKYKGVSFYKSKGLWRARIGEGGKIEIGFFESEEEAAMAYDAKAKELFGDFAKLNF